MLTHEPGESNALGEALFMPVKITDCPAAIPPSEPTTETICRSVLIRFSRALGDEACSGDRDGSVWAAMSAVYIAFNAGPLPGQVVIVGEPVSYVVLVHIEGIAPGVETKEGERTDVGV